MRYLCVSAYISGVSAYISSVVLTSEVLVLMLVVLVVMLDATSDRAPTVRVPSISASFRTVTVPEVCPSEISG